MDEHQVIEEGQTSQAYADDSGNEALHGGGHASLPHDADLQSRVIPEEDTDGISSRIVLSVKEREEMSTTGFSLMKALESARSQGYSEQEQNQAEVNELHSEINKLLSESPKKLEEADEQVVKQLTGCLKRLMELDCILGSVQGVDKAVEDMKKLREDHWRQWRGTAYGEKVNRNLTALLEQAYGQKMRHSVPKKIPNRVDNLANALSELAEMYIEQGRNTEELSCYTDAAVCYQNLLSVYEEEMQNAKSQKEKEVDWREQITQIYINLAEIREAMLANADDKKEEDGERESTSASQLKEEMEGDKQVLRVIREDAKKRVAHLEALLNREGSAEEVLEREAEYIRGSRTLFENIAKNIRGLLARMYKETEEIVGPAPCKYTVMGLGSMALAQMTPYSDLEFAILMQQAEDEEETDANRAYLRKLTHLVHLRVINLGETVIPESKYEYINNKSKGLYKLKPEELGKRGLNFDLGGKTPLGRKDKLYDLIQPLSGMLRYLKNEGNKIEHIDKLLPFILESTCNVYGDVGLYEAYVAEKSTFLTLSTNEQGFLEHKVRAEKKLMEGTVEMDYSNSGVIPSGRQQLGDLHDFESRFNRDTIGKLCDVKQEIYRLPDRLLFRLAMYYGVLPESGWDAIDQMTREGITGEGDCSKDAIHHLQYAFSFATMLRLRVYLHNGQQAEQLKLWNNISQKDPEKLVQEMFLLPLEALQTGGSLFRYYYTALPLHEKMKMFFLGIQREEPPSEQVGFFTDEVFYLDNHRVNGHVHMLLMQFEEAEKYLKKDLEACKSTLGLNPYQVALSLSSLATVCSMRGNYALAKQYHQQVLDILMQINPMGSPPVACVLLSLGNCCIGLGDYREAQRLFEISLEIETRIDGKCSSTVLGSLGNACMDLGDYNQAREYYEHALQILRTNPRGKSPDVASILSNLSTACSKLADYGRALEYVKEAIQIDEKAYGEDHPRVAYALGNMGTYSSNLSQHKQALEYHSKALEIFLNAYGKVHPLVARSLLNLGCSYAAMKNFGKAQQYCLESRVISSQLFGLEHSEVAATIAQIGANYAELGDNMQAEKHLRQALDMFTKISGPEHPDTVQAVVNLGTFYFKLEDYLQARNYYELAYEIMRKIHGEDHINLVGILLNLSTVCTKLEVHSEGEDHIAHAYYIMEGEYGDEYPSISVQKTK